MPTLHMSRKAGTASVSPLIRIKGIPPQIDMKKPIIIDLLIPIRFKIWREQIMNIISQVEAMIEFR